MILLISKFNISDYALVHKKTEFQQMLKYDATFFNTEKNDPEAYFIHGVIKDLPPEPSDINPIPINQQSNIEAGIIVNNYNTVNNQTNDINNTYNTNSINNRILSNETATKIDAEIINIVNIPTSEVHPTQVGSGNGNNPKKASKDRSDFDSSNSTTRIINVNPINPIKPMNPIKPIKKIKQKKQVNSNNSSDQETKNMFESSLVNTRSSLVLPRGSYELDFNNIDISNFAEIDQVKSDHLKSPRNTNNKKDSIKKDSINFNNNTGSVVQKQKSISSTSLFKTPISKDNFVADSKFKSSSKELQLNKKSMLEANLSNYFEKNPELAIIKSNKKS